jgi:hypothetical protein
MEHIMEFQCNGFCGVIECNENQDKCNRLVVQENRRLQAENEELKYRVLELTKRYKALDR